MSVSPRQISISLNECGKQPFPFFTYDNGSDDGDGSPKEKQCCKLCQSTNKLTPNNYKQFIHKSFNNFFSYKYASSENYYFSKDINEILSNSRTRANFLYKETEILDKQEEYLRRQYNKQEYYERVKILTNYYQFHSEVPRMFMKGICEIIHNFYDKKRKLNYIQVCSLLGHKGGKFFFD